MITPVQGKPRIVRMVVNLRYTTSHGSSFDSAFKSKDSGAALQTIDELARILAVEGKGEEAIAAASAAVKRVKEWEEKNECTST